MTILKVRSEVARFVCPICGVASKCDIRLLLVDQNPTPARMAICGACGGKSIWKQINRVHNTHYDLKLLDPIVLDAPPASQDMPDAVKADYEEARLVAPHSPRSAAALLRLALQKLCQHFGEPGDHLDTDIRSLARKPEFGERLIKAADTVRITGNNAVHPGEMSSDDIDEVANHLFDLLNLIVDDGITSPQKWDGIYNKLPSGAREAAEKKDGRTTEEK